MHEVVHHVAEGETREETCRKAAFAEHRIEAPIEDESQTEVDGWWHHQSHGIIRVIVVNAVGYVVYLLAQWGGELLMKEETVNAVLHQGPEGITGQEQQKHLPNRVTELYQ